MTKEEARILLMDYMYGELEADQATELELFISQHDDLKQELEELTETRSMLQHLPVQSPQEQLVIMEPSAETNTRSSDWWERFKTALSPQAGFARTSFAIAGFVFLFVITGALTNMNVSIGDKGFSMTFGEQPAAQVGYTPSQVELIINQVQKENAQLVNQIVLAAQEQQEEQFQQTLATFAQYIDDQRATDLELMNYSLSSLEETTYNRFRQTDQVLGEIIQTVSTND